MRPETSFKCSQPKQFHSRAETIIISEFSILINSTRIGHVAATWGRVEMRSSTEALNGFGVSEVLILLTTISVPRAFILPPSFSQNLECRPARRPPQFRWRYRSASSGSHSTSHQAARHYRKKAHVSPVENRRRIGRPSSERFSRRAQRSPCRG